MTGPIVVIMADNVPVLANKYDPVKYDFTWNVYDSPSANNYGQKESRDGDSTVGSYHVLLPDGRTQKVSYTVDSYGGMCTYPIILDLDFDLFFSVRVNS